MILADGVQRVREDLMDEAVSADMILKFDSDGGIIGALQKSSDFISGLSPNRLMEKFLLYEEPDDDYYVDAADISAWTAGSAATLTGEDPDVARNVSFKFTDADYSITAFTLTVVGKDIRGTAQTEVFYWAGGLEQDGDMLFSSLTSVTGTAITGNSTADVLNVGFGKKVFKGFSLDPDDATNTLDLTTCRDAYTRPYFEDAVKFYRAEYEIATANPRNWHNVVHCGNELRVEYDSSLAEDEYIRIDWGKKHTLNYDLVTVPERFKELLIDGATGYALESLGNHNINRITDGISVGGQWVNSGRSKVQMFKIAVNSRIPTDYTESFSRS